MYSQKIKAINEFVRKTDPDPIRQAALAGLRARLEFDAPNQACMRCEEADWLLTWQKFPDAPGGDDEWLLILGRCGKFMNLASNLEGGLSMPSIFPICTAMSTNKGG